MHSLTDSESTNKFKSKATEFYTLFSKTSNWTTTLERLCTTEHDVNHKQKTHTIVDSDVENFIIQFLNYKQTNGGVEEKLIYNQAALRNDKSAAKHFVARCMTKRAVIHRSINTSSYLNFDETSNNITQTKIRPNSFLCMTDDEINISSLFSVSVTAPFPSDSAPTTVASTPTTVASTPTGLGAGAGFGTGLGASVFDSTDGNDGIYVACCHIDIRPVVFYVLFVFIVINIAVINCCF